MLVIHIIIYVFKLHIQKIIPVPLGHWKHTPFFKDWSFLILYYIFRKKVAENERLNILALPEVQSDIIHFLLYTYFLKDIVHSWYIIFCSLMLLFFAGSTR